MSGVGKKLEEEGKRVGLTTVCAFDCPSAPDNLGKIWPSLNGKDYECRMTMALFDLPSGADSSPTHGLRSGSE